MSFTAHNIKHVPESLLNSSMPLAFMKISFLLYFLKSISSVATSIMNYHSINTFDIFQAPETFQEYTAEIKSSKRARHECVQLYNPMKYAVIEVCNQYSGAQLMMPLIFLWEAVNITGNINSNYPGQHSVLSALHALAEVRGNGYYLHIFRFQVNASHPRPQSKQVVESVLKVRK